MKRIILAGIIVLIAGKLIAQSRDVPFTLDDRDRIIRTENEISSVRNEMNSLRNEMNSLRNEMNSLKSEMNSRFEAQNQRFESLEKQLDRIYTLMFILLGAIFTLMGYVLWDRRTTVGPVQRENRRIVNALIEYSKENPKLAEILRNSGIL
ncbi:MAG: hypothetical protein FJY07_13845 [Bacteroidetes bacterium]|nr:hypothetical protein [Bacteroidota bacterium]